MAAPKKSRARARRTPVPSGQRSVEVPGWVGPLLLAVAFVGFAAATWRKWPDVLVDFGQQLYIPWRLASGERLYRDIAYFHGPLSQHLNALWFRAFGPSLTILIALNLTIFAGITAMVFTIVKRLTDYLTATVAGLILLAMFGFSEYVGTGNYNYVTPYVHEATHGIVLSLGLILLLARYLARGERATIAGAGACLGLALLTKVDVATAAIAVTAVALPAIWLLVRPTRPIALADLALFGAGVAAPALIFTGYFLTYLPGAAAFRAVFAGFLSVSSDVAKNAFYVSTMGFDDIPANAMRMATMFAIIVGFVAAAAGVNAVLKGVRRPRTIALIIGALFGLVLIMNPDLIPWADLPSAFPLTTATAIAAFTLAIFRSPDRRAAGVALLPMLLWGVFALVLLAKIVLHARIEHYGFYLAMPAMILLTMSLVYWLPRVIAARWGSGEIFRMLALGALTAMVIYEVNSSQALYATKNYVVGTGGDAIVTYGPDVWPPTAVTEAALRWIDTNMPPTATFVAMPEGITLNYLSRRPTTSPVINFMVTEMIVFGEHTIVASLERRPPDYVVLVDKDTSEFGVGPFGTDPAYGRQIMMWVDQHYDEAVRIGAEPFRGHGFGIKILKRAR